MAALAILAPEFVDVFFGDAWMGMVPIIQWLSILGAFQSIISLNGVIYNSIGKPHIAFRVSAVVAVIMVACFIAGIWINGLMGITIAYFIAGSVLSLPIYWMAIKQIDLTLGRVFKVLWPCVLATLVTSACVIAGRRLVMGLITNLEVMICALCLGLVVYVAALLAVDRQFRILAGNFLGKTKSVFK
jgi:PST family polysaccharide transporter